MRVKPRSLAALLWPHARPYTGSLVLVLVLGTIAAFAQQSAFVLIKPTWEILFPVETAAAEGIALPVEGTLAEIKAWADGLVKSPDADLTDPEVRESLLLRVCGIIAVISVIGALAGYAFHVLARWAALRMIVGLRLEVARHMMGLSLRYHGKRKFGDLLSRVSADVNKAMTIVNTVLRDLIQEPLMAITALAMAFVLAPEATLFVVVGLPVMIFPIAKLLKRVRRGSTKSLDQLGASVQALAQMFIGIRTVKAFRAEERELDRYRDMNDKYVTTTMKMVRASALSRAWTLLYTHMGLAVVLLVLGWLALRGGAQQESSDLAPFFLLISKGYTSIKATTRAWSKLAEAQGACDRLHSLFEERPDIVEREDARVCAGLGSGVRFEGVSFSYPGSGGAAAINDLDLEIRPGETLAIVGPSGAGKSTFLDLVARFVDTTAGRITVDGVDVRDLTLDSWTAQFAMVTQDPFLFHATVEDNIRYGRFDATHEDVVAAARAANIHDFVVALPQGYETDVADAGSRLSGGQRQRITIARAILHGGELLLLDEATSALDTESEAVVQAALDELMADKTVVVIAHRLSTVRNADRIVVLDAGRLVEVGTHDELIANSGVYARLYAMQFASPVA